MTMLDLTAERLSLALGAARMAYRFRQFGAECLRLMRAGQLELMKMKNAHVLERERTVIERQTLHLKQSGGRSARRGPDRAAWSSSSRSSSSFPRSWRALEVANPLLTQRAHSLEVRVPRSGLLVDGDPSRLTQVLANLLTNAAKYTPPRGRITITADSDDADVRLSVRGIGMTADTPKQAFESFVQGRQGVSGTVAACRR